MLTSHKTIRTITNQDVGSLYDSLCKIGTCDDALFSAAHKRDCKMLAGNLRGRYIKEFQAMEANILILIKGIDIAIGRLHNLEGSWKRQLVDKMMFDYEKLQKDMSTKLYWLKHRLTVTEKDPEPLRKCQIIQLQLVSTDFKERFDNLFSREKTTILEPYCAAHSTSCDNVPFCKSHTEQEQRRFIRFFRPTKTSCKLHLGEKKRRNDEYDEYKVR